MALMEHACIETFLETISRMNAASAKVYGQRLKNFDDFCLKRYNVNTDRMIDEIKHNRRDPYKVLNQFIDHLQYSHTLSPLTLNQQIITTKNLFEYHDVNISNVKFKFKVKFPRTVRRHKQALSKDDVCNIINSCSQIRLKTYVILLAATGMRAVEALSVRIKDFDSKSCKIILRGGFTKTRTERVIWLTEKPPSKLRH